ncbi:MAG: hypothetical protein HC837_16885 [Chloroflexaceae bacterium]|nr:hypothetical protein [Chloroflexaceae bacterium]
MQELLIRVVLSLGVLVIAYGMYLAARYDLSGRRIRQAVTDMRQNSMLSRDRADMDLT